MRRLCDAVARLSAGFRRFLQNRFQARDCERAIHINEGQAGESSFDWSMQTDYETVGLLAIEVGIGF